LGKQIKKNNKNNKHTDYKDVPAGPETKKRNFIVGLFSHNFGSAIVLKSTFLRHTLQHKNLTQRRMSVWIILFRKLLLNPAIKFYR